MTTTLLRERRIGNALRRARENAGLTIEEAAGRLGWSSTKLSRIENGRISVQPGALDKLAGLYEISEPHYHALHELSGHAGRTGAVSDHDEVAEMLEWAPLTVPVPLRTADYARYAAAGAQQVTRVTASQIAGQVEDALNWQLRITSPGGNGKPLLLHTVIDESVLYRRIDGGPVMGGQLALLAQLAVLGNADIRVLPLTAGSPCGIAPPFTYYAYADFAGLSLPDAVRTDGLRAVRTEDENDVVLYRAAFARLQDAALGREESAALFTRMAQAWIQAGPPLLPLPGE